MLAPRLLLAQALLRLADAALGVVDGFLEAVDFGFAAGEGGFQAGDLREVGGFQGLEFADGDGGDAARGRGGRELEVEEVEEGVGFAGGCCCGSRSGCGVGFVRRALVVDVLEQVRLGRGLGGRGLAVAVHSLDLLREVDEEAGRFVLVRRRGGRLLPPRRG